VGERLLATESNGSKKGCLQDNQSIFHEARLEMYAEQLEHVAVRFCCFLLLSVASNLSQRAQQWLKVGRKFFFTLFKQKGA
jgi:hypothetical protein